MILHIDAPQIIHNTNNSELSAKIHFSGWNKGVKELWYRVDKEYSEYLCDERGDAFLIALLPFALSRSTKEDPIIIESDAPISEKLFYQLTIHFIPTLARCVSWCDSVKIKAELVHDKLPSKDAVGVGISGGVDSYYSLLKSLNSDPTHYKVTHGLFCENEYSGSFNNELQTAYRNMAQKICEGSNINFIDIQSNICNDIYELVHEVVVTNIYLSYAYTLQKLFSTYYFSASHLYEAFEIAEYSSEYSAVFNMYCMENENMSLYVTGADAIRHQKTAYIANYELPKKYMMVCRNPYVEHGQLKNCSKCSKCTRTMIDLDLADKLDEFDKVFDVDNYRKNKEYYWGYLFFKGKKDAFIRETLELMKQKHIKIPLSVRIAGIKKIIKNKGKRGNPLQTSYRP